MYVYMYMVLRLVLNISLRGNSIPKCELAECGSIKSRLLVTSSAILRDAAVRRNVVLIFTYFYGVRHE